MKNLYIAEIYSYSIIFLTLFTFIHTASSGKEVHRVLTVLVVQGHQN